MNIKAPGAELNTAMKAVSSRQPAAPRSLNLSAMCRWVVSFTLRLFYSHIRDSQYICDRLLGAP
jgi:hypothetical protein